MHKRVLIAAISAVLSPAVFAQVIVGITPHGFALIDSLDSEQSPAPDDVMVALSKAIQLARSNPADLALPYLDEVGSRVVFNATSARGIALIKSNSSLLQSHNGIALPPGSVEPQMAKVSVARMQAIRDAIVQYVSDMNVPHVISLSDSAEMNKVVVSVTQIVPELDQFLAQNFPTDEVAMLISNADVGTAIGRFRDTSPFYGGARFVRANGDPPVFANMSCTSGIPWRVESVIHGTRVLGGMVTAGHCVPRTYQSDYWTWGATSYSPITTMGTSFIGWSNWGPGGTVKPFGGFNENLGDVALILMTKDGKDVSNFIYRGPGISSPGAPVDYVSVNDVFYRPLVAGRKPDRRICFSGAISGESCRYVVRAVGDYHYVRENTWARGVVTVTRSATQAASCLQPGDSGAPVYSYPGVEGDEARYHTVKVHGVLSGAGFESNTFKCIAVLTDIHTFDKALIGGAAVR
ncbi:hypothetical protein ACS5PN_26835 [Roseateles sp. NT4]|uniref:hypothetical protein n=1 Tax=Roseateles sp. NT4 TaxID=3453715 RepID=UPI003EE98415